MQPNPVTVEPTASLNEAGRIMLEAVIRHVPVVSSGDLVGILTERDVATYLAQNPDADPGVVSVYQAMTEDVHVLAPNDALDKAARRMANEKIGCMPVVDAGRLIGIITTTDMLSAQGRRAFPLESTAQRMTVAGIMTPDPIRVGPDELVVEALWQMREVRIRHLPVVDDDDIVLGILSDRDLRTSFGDPDVLMADLDNAPGIAELSVGEVMTSNPVVARRHQPVTDLARSLISLPYGALPVVDDDRRLIGIVSYVDVLRVLVD